MDNFINFFQSNKINIFDIIVAIIILYNLISSLKKGFVLSLIYFLKWIIAFVIAKFSIPYALPYVSKIIENESTARTVAGVTVFLLSLFLIIVLGKAMGKSLKWGGLGGIDKLFGFIFGGITGYFYCVIILSLSNYIYLYDKPFLALFGQTLVLIAVYQFLVMVPLSMTVFCRSYQSKQKLE